MATESASGAPIDFEFFDSDNHYYEPRDAFTRHMPADRQHLAIRVERDEAGKEAIIVGGRPWTFLSLDEYNFDRTVRPGSLAQMLRDMSSGRPFEETQSSIPMASEFVDRDARLALMDRQGVESTFMFPTFGVGLEHFMRNDPDLLYANLEAFNRWVDEDWGYAHQGRIFAAPVCNLTDPQLAVAELDRVVERGARIVQVLPGPWGGRSPAHRVYDPFWSRVQDAGVVVAFHIGNSGYNELFSAAWGEEANPPAHGMSAFQWTAFYGDRPIMDTLMALIFHNLFGRFPGVRVCSIENGSTWVAYLLKTMDKMVGMGRTGPWPGGRLNDKPSEIFKAHVSVSPFHEEPIPALVELLGAEQVLFGSDFPHAEGLEHPRDYLRGLEGLDAGQIRALMRDNGRRLVGLAG